MFTAQDIQSRLREKPFTPVRVVTSSGQSYDISHPDLVLVGNGFLIIGRPSNQNPTIIDAASRVATFHITDLQGIPHTAPAGSNGSPES